MAKMTAKEFVNVLTESGLDFEVYGYEGVLNMLSIYLSHEADEYENRAMIARQKGDDNVGLLSLKKTCQAESDFLYDTLSKRGYYERRS